MKDIDKYLYDFIRSDRFRKLLTEKEEEPEVQYPVTMTYALERLTIIHVKLFMLEDEVRGDNLSDEEVGRIKRKIDYWNGIVRPRMIESLGDMAAEAILGGGADVIKEPNLKDYKARN